MDMMRPLAIAVLMVVTAGVAQAGDALIEPRMNIAPGGAPGPRVALTLDACSGGSDMRILDALIANGVPATIFITGRWIASNPRTVELLNRHEALFQIENHGAAHVPAVIGDEKPYGITPAGTAKAVLAEVTGGALAIGLATAGHSTWYRGATALYTRDAMALIIQTGHRIAGFSLNADFGASATAEATAARIAGARDGDVIIAHINQPERASGPGVVMGVLALKAKGFDFVRLDEVEVVTE